MDELAGEVESMWKKAGIPTLPITTIKRKISRMIGTSCGKARKMNKKTRTYPEVTETEKKKLNELLDIVRCICYSNCVTLDETLALPCRPNQADKIPRSELSFYVDQLGGRKMNKSIQIVLLQ